MYAPRLVATEQQRIDRFMYGIPTDIHNNLVGQPHVILTNVIDRVRRIEERTMEVRVAKNEMKKKLKIDIPQSIQRGSLVQQQLGSFRG